MNQTTAATINEHYNIAAIQGAFAARTPLCRQAFERASRVIPGGANRNIVHNAPYPLFVDFAEGAYITDLDGNRYLDMIGNYTAMILGNGNADVTEAVMEQLGRGTAWAAASTGEAALAEKIVARIPSAEKVRFTASGTEATLLAIRAARAFTGRSLVAKFEGGYHGLHDYAMVSVAPDPEAAGPEDAPRSIAAPGIPAAVRDSILVLPFNNPSAVKGLVAKHAAELAAIIVEPVMGVAGTIAPNPGFLDLLRQLASEHGIVLIFDEVITLRLAYGGAEELFGVKPDLRTMGKIIGGGYPIGGIAGRDDIMDVFNPSHRSAVTLSGTFHANPVALAAGQATLDLLTRPVIAELNDKGGRLVAQMRELFDRAEREVTINSIGSLFTIHAARHDVVDCRTAMLASKTFVKALHGALLLEGVLQSPRGMACLSVPMTDGDLKGYLGSLERGLELIAPRE